MGAKWGHMPNWARAHPKFRALGAHSQWLVMMLWHVSDRWGHGYADESWITGLTHPPKDIDVMRALAEAELAGCVQIYPEPAGLNAAGDSFVYRIVGYERDAPKDALRNRAENELAPPEDPGHTAVLSGLIATPRDSSRLLATNRDKSRQIATARDGSGGIAILRAEKESEKRREEKEIAPPVPNESAVSRDEHQGSPSASPVPSGPPHEAGCAGSTDVLSDDAPQAPESPRVRVPSYTPHHEPPRGVRAARYDEEHLDRFSAAFGEAKPPAEWPKGVPFLQPTEEENAHRLRLKAKYEAWLEEEARKAVPT